MTTPLTKGDRVRYTVMYGDGLGSGMAHIVHRPHYGRITSLSEHPRRGTVARIAVEDPKPGSAKYVERAVKDIVRIPGDPGAHYLIVWATEISEQYEAVLTAADVAEHDISDPLAEDLGELADDVLPSLEDHGNPEVTVYVSTDERYITRVRKLTADELAKRQASVARRTASTAAPAAGRTYSLAEIRDGTGFPPGTRFAIVPAS